MFDYGAALDWHGITESQRWHGDCSLRAGDERIPDPMV
jgi:hypothetical protein